MPHRQTAGSGDGAGDPRGDSGVGIGDDVAGGVGRRVGKGGVRCFVCLADGHGFGGGVVVCCGESRGSVNGTASVRSGGVHSVRLQSDISLSAGNVVGAFSALQQVIGSKSRYICRWRCSALDGHHRCAPQMGSHHVAAHGPGQNRADAGLAVCSREVSSFAIVVQRPRGKLES